MENGCVMQTLSRREFALEGDRKKIRNYDTARNNNNNNNKHDNVYGAKH